MFVLRKLFFIVNSVIAGGVGFGVSYLVLRAILLAILVGVVTVSVLVFYLSKLLDDCD